MIGVFQIHYKDELSCLNITSKHIVSVYLFENKNLLSQILSLVYFIYFLFLLKNIEINNKYDLQTFL